MTHLRDLLYRQEFIWHRSNLTESNGRLAAGRSDAYSPVVSDPYPRPTGPAPSLEELRRRRDEIERVASRHGATTIRVFGSVVRGDAGLESGLDLLVDMGNRRSLCPSRRPCKPTSKTCSDAEFMSPPRGGLRYEPDDRRERIGREAVAL